MYKPGDRVQVRGGLFGGRFGTIKSHHAYHNDPPMYYVWVDGGVGSVLIHYHKLRLTTSQRLINRHRKAR
jgi:hypothetical protein